MDYTLVFLLSLLQVLNLSTAAPVPAEVVKMKSKVKWMTEQLVIKLNRDFEFPPDLTLSPPVDELDGSSSVVTVLDGYNNLISDTLNGAAQIKAEISSLTRYLDQWKHGHCSELRPKPPASGRLQELESAKEYVHTVSREALLRVKEFLKLLLKNLDHLETC